MSSELKTIWRHGRVYGLGSLLNRLAGLLLIPVILHVLPTAEWGVYAIVIAVGGLLSVPAISVIDTLMRLYHENADRHRRRRVVSTVLLMLVGLCALFALLSYPIASAVGALVFGHQEHFWVLVTGVFAMAFDNLLSLVLDYFRLRKWSGWFVVATLSRSVAQFGLSILFVVLGALIATAAVSLPLAGFVLSRVGLAFDRGIAREVLGLGLPLVPAWLSKSAYPLVERFMLSVLAGIGGVGVFALATRLAEQLAVLMYGPFSDIWQVRLMELAQDPARAAAFNRVYLYFLFALTSAALGLALFAPELVMVISDRAYWDAAWILPLLALGQILYAVNHHFEICIIQIRRTGFLAAINCSGVALAVALLYLLTSRFGLAGAAVAAVAAQLYRLVTAVWFTARCSDYARLFPWRSGSLLVGLAGLAFVAGLAVTGQTVTLAGLLLKALLCGGFAASVYWGPVLTDGERSAIRHYCRDRLAWLKR